MPKLFRILLVSCFVFFGFTLVSALITDTASAAFPDCCQTSSSPYCDGGNCFSVSCSSIYPRCGYYSNPYYSPGLNCSCPSDQTCNSQKRCVASCQNQCSQGQIRCNGNYPQYCAKDYFTSCWKWSGSVACPANQVCSNGTCVSTCQNQCTLGQKRCDNGSAQTCGDYNNDGCVNEWRGTLCPNGCENGACKPDDTPDPINVCTDTDKDPNDPAKYIETDGSKYFNQYLQGTATGKNGGFTDYCSDDKKSVIEHFCKPDGNVMTEPKSCLPGVCENGACVSSNPNDNPDNIRCFDTDVDPKDINKYKEDGSYYVNPYLKGVAYLSNTSGGPTDYCSTDKKQVFERYCLKDGKTRTGRFIDCPAGYSCDDGACKQVDCAPKCKDGFICNTKTFKCEKEGICKDTDVGGFYKKGLKGKLLIHYVNYFKKGTVTDKEKKPHPDTCDPDTNILMEYYCDGNELGIDFKTCRNGCTNDGASCKKECSDTDANSSSPNGDNPNVSGTATDNKGKKSKDYIDKKDGWLHEKYCNPDGSVSEKKYPCPDGGKNGVCNNQKECTPENAKEVCGECSSCSAKNKRLEVIFVTTDWCKPCQTLKGEITDKNIISKYSDVADFKFLNADFDEAAMKNYNQEYSTSQIFPTTQFPTVFIGTIENGKKLDIRKIAANVFSIISELENVRNSNSPSSKGVCIPDFYLDASTAKNCSSSNGSPGKCVNGECKNQDEFNCGDMRNWIITVINKQISEGKDLSNDRWKINLIDKKRQMCGIYYLPIFGKDFEIDCKEECPKNFKCDKAVGSPSQGFCISNSTPPPKCKIKNNPNNAVANSPEEVDNNLKSATVLLKIESGGQTENCSGTIVDAREGFALIISADHCFRPWLNSGRRGQILVDLQGTPEVERIIGTYINSFQTEDIALVKISVDPKLIKVVKIPNKGCHKYQRGDEVFGAGCAHGTPCAIVKGLIIQADKFLGPSNISVSGNNIAIEGRSGGGLFNYDGKYINLIGVLYARVPSEAGPYGEGLGAGLNSIYKILDTTIASNGSNFSWIYNNPSNINSASGWLDTIAGYFNNTLTGWANMLRAALIR